MEYKEAKLSLNKITFTEERDDVMFDVERDHLMSGKLSKHTVQRVLQLIEEDANKNAYILDTTKKDKER